MILHDVELIAKWHRHPFPELEPNQYLTHDGAILELVKREPFCNSKPGGFRSRKREARRRKSGSPLFTSGR
jgi:hypothetical protein